MLQTYGVLRIISTISMATPNNHQVFQLHTQKSQEVPLNKNPIGKRVSKISQLFGVLTSSSSFLPDALLSWLHLSEQLAMGVKVKFNCSSKFFMKKPTVFFTKNMPSRSAVFPMGFSPISFKKVQIFGFLVQIANPRHWRLVPVSWQALPNILRFQFFYGFRRGQVYNPVVALVALAVFRDEALFGVFASIN